MDRKNIIFILLTIPIISFYFNTIPIKKIDATNLNLIANLPEQNIFLCSLDQEKQGVYNDLLLSVNEKQKEFNWKTVSSEYLPVLKIIDINNDGKKELIVILTEGYGTGYLQQKIHVLNLEDLTEYKIKDPMKIIKNDVQARITSENIAELIYNNKAKNIDLTEYYVGSERKVYFGEIVEYEIRDNQIIAIVSVQVESKSSVIGDFEITYTLKDKEFVKDKIEFRNV